MQEHMVHCAIKSFISLGPTKAYSPAAIPDDSHPLDHHNQTLLHHLKELTR